MKNIQQEQQNDTWARLVDSLWIIDSNLLRKFLTFGSVGRMGISLGLIIYTLTSLCLRKLLCWLILVSPEFGFWIKLILSEVQKKKTFFLGASVIDHRNTCSISMAGLQKLIGNQSKKNYFTYILKKKKKKTLKLHMDILCHLPCNKINKYFLQV